MSSEPEPVTLRADGSLDKTLRRWAEKLQKGARGPGQCPALTFTVTLPGDRNDTYTVRLVVMLESDVNEAGLRRDA